MNKSFGYNGKTHEFRIARHEVGDFGLHLSLIRSFSWGNNFPPELPFFPGSTLPYHYYFDLGVGLLEKVGLRIDLALNGLSVVFFTLLLFFIYKLPQIIFRKGKLIGLLSVTLFIFHSNLTFIDFFKEKTISLSLLKKLWFLPDYIHKGPFDQSTISIFFTLNVFLNQRHLIAALAISLIILYFLLKKILSTSNISFRELFILGIALGLSSRIHFLIFLSTSIVVFCLFIFFKRKKELVLFFLPVIGIAAFHIRDIIGQNLSHPFLNPGFLANKPLTISSFLNFWFLNLGLALFLIPIGFCLSNPKQKKIFLSFLPLFVIPNLFQLSFRIDHNHAIFNYFLIFANFYIAYFLVFLFGQKLLGKIIFNFLVFFLIISGLIDLMPIKNDFQLKFADAPNNKFMQWIKNNTGRDDVFLSREEILDPVIFSGRKNYFGNRYYLSVLGYNFSQREKQVKDFFEVSNIGILDQIRKKKIKYIVIPMRQIPNFNYNVNINFLEENLTQPYKDDDVLVFKL